MSQFNFQSSTLKQSLRCDTKKDFILRLQLCTYNEQLANIHGAERSSNGCMDRGPKQESAL